MQSFHLLDYQNLFFRVPERHQGTCSWLTDDSLFVQWETGIEDNYLWTYGPPGTGKSVLAKYVFKVLTDEHPRKTRSRRSNSRTPASLACYFFCFEDDERAKSPRHIVASIIHQLLLQDPSLAKELEETYKNITHKETESLWALWDILSLTLKGLGSRRLFLVIDALDEMDKDLRKAFLQRLRQVVRPDMHNVRIFLTSRKESDLERTFVTWNITSFALGRDSEGNSKDLSSFLKGTIRDYAKENYFDNKTANLIYREIVSRADGMFMWAVLAWNNFTDGVGLWTNDLIAQRIADMRRLPPGMEHLYHHLLLVVDKTLRPELVHILQWITAAKRPLSINEISHALALAGKPQSSAGIKKRLSIRAFLARTCPHLLHIDDKDIVTIIHQSFKDFLLGVRHVKGEPNIFFLDLKTVNLQIAQDCILYMGLSDMSDEKDGPWVVEKSQWSDEDVESRERKARRRAHNARLANFRAKYPFIDYAVEGWSFHLKGLDDDHEFYKLFKRVTAQERNFQVLNNLSTNFMEDIQRPPIWVAFEYGFYDLVKHLVKDGHDINDPFDGYHMIHRIGCESLVRHWVIDGPTEARLFKNFPILEKLLSLGLNINGRNIRGSTVLLCLATEANSEGVAKYHSKVHEALSPGQAVAASVRTWLKMPNVEVNAKDPWGTTPLHAAACHIAPIAKALIETLMSDPSLDLNPEDERGRTPLNLAIYWGKQETARLLMEIPGVKIDTSFTIQGESPLINAARQGWQDLVLSMLRHLTSDEIPKHLDLHERNILHWTISGGMTDASFLAIRKNQTLVGAADTRGITPLHLASQAGQDQIVKALLLYGASPTSQTRFGETPLHVAAAEGRLRVLKRLMKSLSSPSDINKKDKMGWTVTHRAVTSGNEDLQRFLVSLPDVDLQKPDRHGRTPIAFAASLASLNTLQIFLRAQPDDIDFMDEFGNTLLHLAAGGNNQFTIPFLLEAVGRKGNQVNDWGKTALDLLPMESPQRAEFILSGLVHSAGFFNRRPRCCFRGIRPKTPNVHYDWKLMIIQRYRRRLVV